MDDYAAMIINGAMQIGTSLMNNSMASWREQTAREENSRLNEIAAQNADARTRKLYEDLQSPAAMLRQIKEAGLSPSLMFGGSGQGAQPSQGAQGAGATGISPNTYGMTPIDWAQLNYINAQTRKTEAEAKNEEGTGAIGSAKIREMLSQAGLNEALTYYNNAATEHQNLENYILNETKDFDIFKAQSLANKAFEESQKAIYEVMREALATEFDTQTFNDRIKSISLQNQNITFDTLLKKSGIELNETEVQRINAEVGKWQQELIQGYADLLIKEKNANTQENFMRNINDFWDAQEQNLKDRLNFDKSKFSKEMRYKYTALLNTFIDENLDRGSEMIMELIPLGKNPKKAVGL